MFLYHIGVLLLVCRGYWVSIICLFGLQYVNSKILCFLYCVLGLLFVMFSGHVRKGAIG